MENTMELKEYKKYLITFIDVLGFKEIVDGDNKRDIETIVSMLEHFKKLDISEKRSHMFRSMRARLSENRATCFGTESQ
jgi:hypothetical protein